jgi:hypothetical protein
LLDPKLAPDRGWDNHTTFWSHLDSIGVTHGLSVTLQRR